MAVVIVGAGLSGHLTRRGVEVTVLEAADAIGGRVRTDVVDGYRLDRGFQRRAAQALLKDLGITTP